MPSPSLSDFWPDYNSYPVEPKRSLKAAPRQQTGRNERVPTQRQSVQNEANRLRERYITGLPEIDRWGNESAPIPKRKPTKKIKAKQAPKKKPAKKTEKRKTAYDRLMGEDEY
jgi:hypothetical protein